MGVILMLAIVVLGIGGAYLVARSAILSRERRITSRYSDPDVARRIVGREFWVGQTAEMLRDSLGSPVRVVRDPEGDGERWSYGQRRGDRYELEIELEEGAVVDWVRTTRWSMNARAAAREREDGPRR
jgi:hypothetical protein